MYDLNTINYNQILGLPTGKEADYLVTQAVYSGMYLSQNSTETFHDMYNAGHFRYSEDQETMEQALRDFFDLDRNHKRAYAKALYEYFMCSSDIDVYASFVSVIDLQPIDKCRCMLLVARGFFK